MDIVCLAAFSLVPLPLLLLLCCSAHGAKNISSLNARCAAVAAAGDGTQQNCPKRAVTATATNVVGCRSSAAAAHASLHTARGFSVQEQTPHFSFDATREKSLEVFCRGPQAATCAS